MGRRETRVRVIDHAHLLGHRIQNGATQLPVVSAVARVSGRSGVDHQNPSDALHHLAMRMSIKHDIRVGLGEPVQFRAMRMHIFTARFPGRRMDQQQPFPRQIEIPPMRPRREKLQQIGIDSRTLTGTNAGGRQENFLVIAQYDVCAAFAQTRDDIVGKLIFKDAVAEAKQFVDLAHRFQGKVQSADIAMKIRNDPDFQWRGPASANKGPMRQPHGLSRDRMARANRAMTRRMRGPSLRCVPVQERRYARALLLHEFRPAPLVYDLHPGQQPRQLVAGRRGMWNVRAWQ